MKSSILISILSLILISCAGVELTTEQCQSFSWETKGKEDGAKGENKFPSYKNACLESNYLVGPSEKSLYTDGFKGEFCTSNTAFKLGLDLRDYNLEECSAEKKEELSSAYTLGKKRGTLKSQLKLLAQKLREIESDLRKEDLEESVKKSLKIQQIAYEKEERELERELSSLPETFIK